MKTNMTFGECLGYLLSVLKLSINRLSKVINVDNSLVSRWIHGKRIPPYHTSYIEDISEYLSKNVHNTIQRQNIDELFLSVCAGSETKISIKEKIREVLLETQGFSIECREQEKREYKELLAKREVISNSVSNDEETYMFNDENFISNSFPCSVNLSSEDKIIFSFENLLAASIFLLEEAIKLKCKSDNTIYITFVQDLGMDSIHSENVIRFRNALLKAMLNGWNVLFLLKLSYNINKTIKLIEFTKPLLRTGRFNVYYVKKCDSFLLGKEIIAVPEVGVLSCFSTKFHSETNCAFYLKNKTAINIFKEHLDVLIRCNAVPLIKYYQCENITEYNSYLIEKEENIGNRFIYKYYFSDIILTEGLYKKILKRKNWSNDEIEKAIKFYKKRLNAFLINIENYQYNDIYYTDSIKELIINQKFYFYSYKGIEQADLEVEDIIEYLESVIYFLEKYKNFSIAFDSLENQCVEENELFYCLVKERQAIFLEVFDYVNCNSKVRLSIEEPIVVRAFDEYFNEIWEQISPINREKDDVITWIKRQINILENRLQKS